MFGFLPLLVIGVVIWAIVSASRKNRSVAAGVGGEVSTRRLFQYAIAYAAFVVAASGLASLVENLAAESAARRGSDLAGPLAMTVVGVPVFALLARWIWRIHRADPAERHGLGWGLYLNAALITSLFVSVGAAFGIARGVVGSDELAAPITVLVVWGGAWAGHWLVGTRIPPTRATRVHVWIGSIAGLVIAAVSTGFVLAAAGERLLDAAASGVTASLSGEDVGVATVGILIGAAVWGWHWLLHGLRAPRTEGWYATVLLVGVLGGLMAAVTGAGHGLYLVLVWLFGDPDTTSAVSHFRELATASATGLVGVVVWRYHRAVVGPTAARDRTETDRAYDYLVAGVGLVTVGIALVVIVMAIFEAASSAVAAGGGESNVFWTAVTLLVVGLPVWWVAWQRTQSVAAADPAEAGSTGRRTYLLAVFGVGGAVAFGALIALLVAVFEAILDDRSGNAVSESIDLPVALLAATGAAAVYHWFVYRAERSVEPSRPRRDVLLVTGWPAIGPAVEERAHVRVTSLHRLDEVASDGVDIGAIVAAIDGAEGDHLLVLAGAERIEVVPVE